MSADNEAPPENSAWVVSVHESEDADESLGSGVVIGAQRILTCAHVVGTRNGNEPWSGALKKVWVAFPMREKGDTDERVPVSEIVFPKTRARAADLAVLRLADSVPEGVAAAPLRVPQPKALRDRQWLSFGFPDGDLYAEDSRGQVRGEHGHGLIGLKSDPGFPLKKGFSGAGLWSPLYGAVVAVINQARDDGDGRAITLHQAGQWFAGEKISALAGRFSAADAGEVALSAWGWSLSQDPEGPRHWRPRGRGVAIDSERGYRFRGRVAALTEIRDWLDRAEPDQRVLVLTGSPGAGKSAVLGRIVTTADADAVAQLPAFDDGVKAVVGSVACAVHAKGKTALEVAAEIARAASAAIPERIEDFAPALTDVFQDPERPRSRDRFNVIIDALDEASPGQARAIIRDVIRPLAETLADDGAQMVVGTRRTDASTEDKGDLLDAFGDAKHLVDLDKPSFFDPDDLAAYVLATLQLAGAKQRAGNPYNDGAVAGPVAARIAELSERNFLVAGLTAREHGLHDTMAPDPAALSFSPTVEAALHKYLERVPVPAAVSAAAPGVTATSLLTALAFAEAPGFSAPLWRTVLRTLGVGDVPGTALAAFARSAAASFLVESSGGGREGNGENAAFRLFHQALNDALLASRAEKNRLESEQHALTTGESRAEDEGKLTRAFHQIGRAAGWENAPGYLLRSLPGHAALAGSGTVDKLLDDDAYLLHAELRRLIQAAGSVSSSSGRDRVRLLRLTPEAIIASPDERAALFSVTETLEDLGNAYRDGEWQAPYRALWATTEPRRERATLTGHQGGVDAVCAVPVDGEMLLATASGDCTVRVWDPRTGQLRRVLEGHEDEVRAMCAVPVDSEMLLATASDDCTVRVWDPRTGQLRQVLEGHQNGFRLIRVADPSTGQLRHESRGTRGGVWAVCVVPVDGETFLATGGADGTVRVWDPRTGQQAHRVLEGHEGEVRAVCAVPVDGEVLLATGSDSLGYGDTVRVWDPRTGQLRRELEGHEGGVRAVCAVPVDGEMLLATASGNYTDAMVEMWDPRTGQLRHELEGYEGEVGVMCVVPVDGETLLAVGGYAGVIRVWDLSDAEQFGPTRARYGPAQVMCAVLMDGETFLATGGADRTVRVWDPQTGQLRRELEDPVPAGDRRWISAVCAVPVDGETLLATGTRGIGSDGAVVRLWDLRTGRLRHVLKGHYGGVVMCVVPVDGEILLATGGDGLGDGGTVRVWDPRTGRLRHELEDPVPAGDRRWISAVCAVPVDGETLLAAACGGMGGGESTLVRVWDLRTGQLRHVLKGHYGGVRAVCVVPVDGETLLAAATGGNGLGGAVRVWDPRTGRLRHELEGHDSGVRAMCVVPVDGETLLATATGGDDDAYGDGVVRVWDPRTGQLRHELEGHEGEVRAMCVALVDGEPRLATASLDCTVRVWDLHAGKCAEIVPTHHDPLAVADVAGSLAINTDAGLLVIRLGITD